MTKRMSRKMAAPAVVFTSILLAFVPGSALASSMAKAPSSPEYAGWITTDVPASASAGTTFTVPQATCTSADIGLVIPGVGLPTASSIIASGVSVDCQKAGAPAVYKAVTDINGVVTQLHVAVQPGDSITTSLTVTASATTGTFADVTTGKKTTIKGEGGKATGSCVGIDGQEENSSANPVPDFGKVVFKDSALDGKSIRAAAAFALNMATANGVLQIRTGALNSAGTGFTSTFVNAG